MKRDRDCNNPGEVFAFTKEQKEIHKKGLTLFTTPRFMNEYFYHYVVGRYLIIESKINSIEDDDDFITFKSKTYFRGAVDLDFKCRVRDIKGLAKQDNNTPISSNILNFIASVVNIHSYRKLLLNNNQLTRGVFVMDFDYASCILRQTTGEISTNIDSRRRNLSNRGLTELYVKISKIIMFPIITKASHFALIVLLPTIYMVITLSSTNSSNEDVFGYNDAMLKIIAYYNMITEVPGRPQRRPEEWTIYIDGQNKRPHLNHDGENYSNCGAFVCLYILTIAFHTDIDTVVSSFESGNYLYLFEDIKVDTILYKKTLLTVMLNDFENFLE